MSKSIEIIITGDFVPYMQSPIINEAQLAEYIYDAELLYKIHNADLSITNLEVPLTKASTPINKSGPNLCAPPENINFIKLGGFDMVTLANNHIMDYDSEGLKETLNVCKTNGIEYIGAGLTSEEANKTIIKEIKGKRIAIINTGENEFLFSKTSTAQAHNFDLIDIFTKVQKAKDVADFVLLIYHGGVEHFQLPYPRMRKNLGFLAQSQVNAIVCHHSHCFSGFEYFGNTPVFYGLGNFFFERKINLKTWHEGFVLKLVITPNLKLDFKLIPYKQSMDGEGIRLLKGEHRLDFDNRIVTLNSILQDTNLYNAKWDDLVTNLTPKLIRQIYPLHIFSNDHKNLVRHRGTKKIKYLLNLIRTESSYSCLLKALDNIY